ncbi:hypothetical protein A3I41_01740 [Candidatus Uhrbacteria bacterium RIFCSPLOWO2_02_FULL_48_18]|uniref:Uncharacterized protein n=1 Tax=Candidatus Uhrbacteria bacterium RIFCSPLOWO2_02_FULL_48_18 TaxID=1802408 RepID=A0A1F7V6T7_9BACT|nr:MAG: hypothetical protein A2839_05455 [Candidatus Uhrbacteria bacterium RIFCSPHIGHO2_01_FULL_47_10]OGL80406.1 MAG: hypothetical protein A3B20_03255 [Candidatus Uhrbacteria bacterium RIFCSPLOWO2_01_FULL_47_17]OGL86266.1 MAG: hypothetical protein A3I41_01740 [Candidatus Uhrbacteria bacterium RIFCSPLOWO2_02_FULL_48_18]OGL91889.1 MAG: hypothetical protein A3H12_04220 [Candidatus Uhrbacteria bacterium RIFCSPLOWO2_12_FULL_47_9]
MAVGRVAQFALCVFVAFLAPLARNRLPNKPSVRTDPARDFGFPTRGLRLLQRFEQFLVLLHLILRG